MKRKRKKYDKTHVAAFVLIIFLAVLGWMNNSFSQEGKNIWQQGGGEESNAAILKSPASNPEDSGISKSGISDEGTLNFRWSNSEVSNRIDINKKGIVDWRALRDYPAGCPEGQAIRQIGDKIDCIDVDSSSEDTEISWQEISSFPESCGEGKAVKAIGNELTCVDLNGESLFTDGGATTYLSSLTDNLAIGGTGSSAPLFFDTDDGKISVSELQAGGSANNLSISDEGFLELNSDATVWEDLRVPVTATTREGSKQPVFGKFKDNGSGSQGVFTFWFDPDTEKELYFTAQIPHDYKAGSSIYPHVHWIPESDGSAGQKVSWGLEYTWSSIASSFGNTNIIYANTTYPDETLDGGKHYMTSFSSISGSGKGYSSMLVCRIFRNATGAGGSSDGYTQDAGLIEIDFHYEIDKMGTAVEY